MSRQTKYALLLVMLALAAVAVPIAGGTSTAKDPRVAGLTKKVNSLTKSVNALRGSVTTLQTDLATAQTDVATLKTQMATVTTKANCITGAARVVLRGAGPNDGYLYTPDNQNLVLESAYDAPLQGEAPSFLAATVNPQCVTTALFRLSPSEARGSSRVFRGTIR
jgi:outer membrane murein-binding lipoprotein Lpp